MDFLADLLLAVGATGAAVYCAVLSRRLRALGGLDGNLGTAIAVLSAQVDALTRALEQARAAATVADERSRASTERAEAAARKLELLLAALHDLPKTGDGKGEQAHPPPKPAAKAASASPLGAEHGADFRAAPSSSTTAADEAPVIPGKAQLGTEPESKPLSPKGAFAAFPLARSAMGSSQSPKGVGFTDVSSNSRPPLRRAGGDDLPAEEEHVQNRSRLVRRRRLERAA